MPIRFRYMMAGIALFGLAACGETSPKWEPQDMMGGPAEQKNLNDTYARMVDFKAMATDDTGKPFYAGPSATVVGAGQLALAMCQNAGGPNCRVARLGLTSIEGLDQQAVSDVIKSYNDTLTAEATQAARAGNIEAANWLAYHYATKGENLGEAERLIKLALKVQPDNPSIQDTYGLILYKKGDYAAAEEALIQANKAAPIAEHLAHFADNALAMGKRDMARVAYQRALDANPDPVLSQRIQKQLLAIDMAGGIRK
ncbi:M48 family metallopeptidase [Thalassospira sp. TSL5-1]|uniref:tetratricopeptide repeat protein n=1 Tax=Thalassospira sp. TSL5-1 TaxID=1544451 RepID=UPI00093F9E21|nr:hypothetical protein [Thalassospira sp. TSL5-1]OKH87666.1 hypothetical protein LF95_12985 [Thalassospira sp. TSL5-1]